MGGNQPAKIGAGSISVSPCLPLCSAPGAGEDAAFYPLRRFASAPLEKQGEPRVRREPGAGRRYVQRFPEAGMIWYDNYRGTHNVLKKIDIFDIFGLIFTSTDGKYACTFEAEKRAPVPRKERTHVCVSTAYTSDRAPRFSALAGFLMGLQNINWR